MKKKVNVEVLTQDTKLFAELTKNTRKEIIKEFTSVNFKKGQVIFSQGDLPDAVYIVLSGRLLATLTMNDGSKREVGYINPGETVGELGALSNEPRTLTITAVFDSYLLKLPAREFIELAHRHPSIMFATLHPVIARSRHLIQLFSRQKKNTHIIIIAANDNVDMQEFSATLSSYAEQYNKILVLTDKHTLFQSKHKTLEQVREQISALSKDRKTAHTNLYLLSSIATSLAKFAFSHADTIYVLGDARVKAKLTEDVLNRLRDFNKKTNNIPNLILLHPADAKTPQHAKAWLQQTNFKLYHHVRLQNKNDYLRLLRFVRQRAVGLVLGGGGTRGWGHLGVIKAMREQKTPIDIIGGTSVGALIAANYAINHSYEEAYRIFEQMVKESKGAITWRGWTWPAISIYSSERYTTSLQTAYEELTIEEMWTPYFCITSNLTKTMEEVHTTGLIWEVVRASSAIPGVVPPMIIKGEMHFDGGLLNNLPVDIMRQILGPQSKIIAVEINGNTLAKKHYSFPPSLTFTDVLLTKLGFYRYTIPPFLETFLRSIFLGSVLKTKTNALAADLLISLNLGRYNLLSDSMQHAKVLVNHGYKNYLHQIK